MLAVRDEIGYVVAALQSCKGGVCRDCYQILDEAWASLCSDCCRGRHNGVDDGPDEPPHGPTAFSDTGQYDD